eukprot:XP_001706592.1 Hypothetical protein GL50803_10763 [Giardia lamblia ATCC 50803]
MLAYLRTTRRIQRDTSALWFAASIWYSVPTSSASSSFPPGMSPVVYSYYAVDTMSCLLVYSSIKVTILVTS